MRRRTNALVILLAAVAACGGYRPARFASAPPVVEVADDRPIPLPPRREPVPEIVLSEAYVRRPLVAALDPTRIPDARDVNAFDDVPRSSWFDPRLGPQSPASDGPPVLPLQVLEGAPESSDNGLRVADARGIRYEIVRDPPERPGLRSGATAASSRLLRALGYFAAEAWALEVPAEELKVPAGSVAEADRARFLRGESRGVTVKKGAERPPDARVRVGAVRWPVGIDVGPTPAVDERGDDPNDRVPHTERRTLRALKLALYWIGMSDLSPRALRDVYVGAPGKGFLRHYIVGLHTAFGAGAVVRDDSPDAEWRNKNALLTLGSLGLAKQGGRPVQTKWLALGDFDEDASITGFTPTPPFDPIDRLLPADAYWMAKRLAAVPDERIAEALDAAKFSDPAARERAKTVLDARRAKAVVWSFLNVTPCEVAGVERDWIVVRDEAIVHGAARAEVSRYEVSYLDQDGHEIAKQATIPGSGETVSIPVPDGEQDYVVVRVFTARDGKRAPRAFEAHLERRKGGLRLLGVRH